ncbi:ATP-binding protein [Pseudalkalibacillus salsuginis]|uniref:ATP-binding protein n=1 Tax=Pseudalkalibacillus salsuginis TaxID=2910972 RepID=UPI001F2A754A|nr:sensor histidine kinase [Pseudalkalibacillus salsuginis]MCF6409938.1 sensor histidine kinase [Pseudalkalibacillus salsuginis]
MSLQRLPIRWKITILSFGIVLFSLLIGGIILTGNIYEMKERDLGHRSLLTARTVANLPEVQSGVVESRGWIEINPIVERIRTINNADYIVILDMNRIRYSHPNEDMLGTLSSGKDEGPAFAEHTYTSKAQGELGTAVRAFVPIMNEQKEQVGTVVVGIIQPTLWEVLGELKHQILIIALLALLFGIIGSWLLARHLKQETFQLEPYEIVRLLKERTATLQAMNEGIIAIDRDGRITVFNDKAKRILNLQKEVAGKQIEKVIPESKLGDVLINGASVYKEGMKINENIIMSSRVPILVEGEIVGAVEVFQDRTEVTSMAEELTGVKAFVEALRVQNHEHMNRLHTIAGLIQLNENDKALEFLFENQEEQQALTKFLSKQIHDESIAGLLLSKISRAKELDIDLTITPESRLKRFPGLLDRHDFVLVLGNLIENAFDAFVDVEQDMKLIEIHIEQSNDLLYVSVEDNGKGMTEDDQAAMFTKGYTTKGSKGSGIGLYLVRNVLEKGEGSARVKSIPQEGTSIELSFPMRPGGIAHEQISGH